ncbi:adenylate/guanylate cyclase domain-containing protein [Bradyrhizobium sp. NAS80.1]|uniref:adenylate/guanylate cyclase domain-containing protein n=1 Tax=Bradyrhizobium sp. NAS80.1 TaxID=1680159 RepID=UPI00143D27B9|nr:adenylate/guanylate cyclase domain-containing protein [Bradyrhizobium sp. NAS80.1]
MSETTLVTAIVVIFLLLHVLASAIAVSGLGDRLVDPLRPYIAAVLVFALTAGTAYWLTRRREAFVRHRLEQHLAPAVVRSIVEQPDLIKLDGERREVTALFTDIEGFTATTHRVGPEQLVATLDQYFEGVSGIVIKHGGMIDKFVGDGVHALFNAPLDLEDHPQRAVECAIAIRTWTEGFRRRAAPRSYRARPHPNRDRDRARHRRRRRHSIQTRLHGSRRWREHGGAARGLQQ